jgi:hypothetical protein
MSNLPKFYFQDIPADVMAEIMSEMESALLNNAWEEIDEWFSRDNNTRPLSRPGTSERRNSSPSSC